MIRRESRLAQTGSSMWPTPAPVAFKELAGWKISQPADTVDKGIWWSVYHDGELDRLERMVEVSNQTVKQFEAQYSSAVALVAEARAVVGLGL